MARPPQASATGGTNIRVNGAASKASLGSSQNSGSLDRIVSYAPTESSLESELPRFRTVDSWVGNQSERVQRRGNGVPSSATRTSSFDSTPPVPEIPRDVV